MAFRDGKVTLNHAGVAKLLDDIADSECRPAAEAGAARARSSAPVASGAYRDSIRVWSETTDRKVWRYGSDLDYAFAVEANHGNLARSL